MCLFAVADGMGGQNAGEVASSIAVTTARKCFAQLNSAKVTEANLEEMFTVINQAVWDYSQSHKETSGMGTTFTTAILSGSRAIIGHVGDSRIYRYRNGILDQLSRDHSLVQEQVRIGKLTREQARTHPTRHILSRVVGGRQFIKPDIFEVELQVGDLFLLCSDGIYGMIEDSEIEKNLKSEPFKDISKKLISSANNAGGKDNSTAIVFRVNSLPISFPGKFSFNRLKKMVSYWGGVGFD